MTDVPYNETFFQYHDRGARQSAAAVVPLVLELVAPGSVVDVGCGVGTWLAEFGAAGIDDYLGIDGDYVERRLLAIPPDRFVGHDLVQPIDIPRRFDLAVCLEVAEHLPPENADTLVDSLVRLAPLVLFSAAIPYQQGDGHVNEQWPEYWRDRFAARDYVVVDAIRDLVWQNDQIEPWYRQNLLFFVQRDRLSDYPPLEAEFNRAGDAPYLSRVHPAHIKVLFEHAGQKIREAKRQAAEARLILREINLLAFPDWKSSPESLLRELRSLLGAFAMHPDRQRLSVVVSIGRNEDSLGTRLISQVHRETLMPGGALMAQAPGVNAVGGPKFSRSDWQALLDCVQGRIIIPGEDTAAVEAAGAAELPTIALDTIHRKQPVVIQALRD